MSPANFAFETFGLVVSIPIDHNQYLKNTEIRLIQTVTFTGGATNSDAIINLRLLPGVTNDAPFFENDPENSQTPIPCLTDSKLRDWSYKFDKPTDPDGDKIDYTIGCSLLSFDFFNKKIEDG